MQTRLHHKRYGLAKVVEEVEQLLLHSKSLEGKFYQAWITLNPVRKERFRKELRRIIQENLLGDEFRKALAKEIITDEGIKVDSPLFKHLKARLYHGDVRRLLSDLQEIVYES